MAGKRKKRVSMWQKALLVLLAVLTGTAAFFHAFGLILVTTSDARVMTEEQVRSEAYDLCSRNYAAYLLSGIANGGGVFEPDSMQMERCRLDYAVVMSSSPDLIPEDLGETEIRKEGDNTAVYLEISDNWSGTSVDGTGEERWTEVLYVSPEFSGYTGFLRSLEGLDWTGTWNTESFLECVRQGPFYDAADSGNPGPWYFVLYRVSDSRAVEGDLYEQADAWVQAFLLFRRYGVLALVLLAAVFLTAWGLLLDAAGRRAQDGEIHLRFTDRIPFSILTAADLMILGLLAAFFTSLVEISREFTLEFITEVLVTIAALAILSGIFYTMSVAVRVKSKQFWRYTLLHYVAVFLRKIRDLFRENTSLTLKTLLALFGVTALEAFVILMTDGETDNELFCFMLYKLLEIPLVVWLALQLNRIRRGAERIAGGDFSQPIRTRHMFWEMKRHAEDLNHAAEGMSAAVDERMRSERMKTELITNVSHDIKTPLTSIINYVDLLQKEEVDNPKAREYLSVLSRQSGRLKKLIEDLIEASKASTGNLEIRPEVMDVSVMLLQAIGEFGERLQDAGLILVVSGSDREMPVLADGRYLWRVFDNLLVNICKYAMPGTRVYLSLAEEDGEAVISFKNISREELNIRSEELLERFVRGDSSRNTEGSGLGLSIARSLTELMGGTLALEIDGDLFKAVVRFPLAEIAPERPVSD